MDDAAALRAIRQFGRELRASVADAVSPLAFGELITTPSMSDVYDLNLAIVDAGARPDPAQVLQEARRQLAGHGAAAGQVSYEDRRAMDEAAPVFEAAGWSRSDNVLLRLRAVPGRTTPPWPDGASVFDDGQREALRRALTWARPWCDRESIVDTFVEYERRSLAAGEGRVVGVQDDEGTPLAGAWVLGGELPGVGLVRQIEEVEVVEEHHGKGLGASVMQAAMHLALADEPALVFVVADADDWPRHWYERLGFEVVGTNGSFLRTPA